MWDAKKYATCNEQKRECFVRKSKKSSPNLDKYKSLYNQRSVKNLHPHSINETKNEIEQKNNGFGFFLCVWFEQRNVTKNQKN